MSRQPALAGLLAFALATCAGYPAAATAVATASAPLGTPAGPTPAGPLATADPPPGAAPGPVVQAPAPASYDIGNPDLLTLWVDPVNGDDARSGATRAEALRTVAEAWNRIPMGTPLATGYQILLAGGVYPRDSIPVYWESRWGTYEHPILLQAADGRGTATLGGDLNVFDTRYFYLLDLNIVPDPPGDVFHCEQCDHLLIRGVTMDGGSGHEAHETIKVNQSQYVYIEDSDIFDTYENAIDFVAVQYGHITGNRLHDADDWCIYLKGGSAYFRIEGNEIYNCGTGGFTAGQGTGFEYMVSPWLHYEAYDIKFVNNLIHDTEGAGMGVNGGYNILLAYNTLYRVGQRSHVIEVVFGARSCDGDTARCEANRLAGGWGTSVVGSDEPIPNRNVFIYNNIVYNPPGYQSQWQHFAIYGPRTPSAGSNIPSPARTDTNLQMRGNLIWNGPPDHPLGIEDASQGCQDSNPTCNAAQLRADNTINQFQPQLKDPQNGNFRPLAGGNVFTATTYTIPDFDWADAPSPPPVPPGEPSNAVPVDRAGQPRAASGPPGAYSTSQTFDDVPPSHWAYTYVEALFASGITGGCSVAPPLYCPASPVTRAQMAVFLLRGTFGAAYTPPAATGAVFSDVPVAHWAAGWIEQLAAEGITSGCAAGLYCPESAVTRAQMAVFLLRGLYGAAHVPPPPTGAVFSDVPLTHWAAAWIEQLAAEGITSGCAAGLYCPENRVTRDQMAVFLVRTFNLPLP